MQLNDIGNVLVLTITKRSDGTVYDASGASTKQILLRKPLGGLLTKTAIFTTDGTDGKIQYTSIDGYLDEQGKWMIQGFLINGGSELYTTVHKFNVGKNA